MPVPSSPPYVHRRVVSVTELPVFAKLERFDRDNSDAVPSHNPDLLSRGRSQEPDHTNSVPSARPVYTTKYEHGRYTVGVEAYLNDTGGGGGVASGHHMHRKTSLPTMGGGVYRASRDRTRVSAVQRLVERKLAQKEKEREKERDRSWTSFNSYTSSNSSSRPRAPNNCSTQSTSYLFGVGGHRSRRDDHSPTGSTFSDAVPRSPGRDCSRGSKSENGFILGAGRCSSPSKENVEPDDWPYAGDNGNTCRSRRRTARSVSGSRLGRFLNNDDDEATVKTYITIGPGKPTRIREHSPAKSAKLSTDETVTSARARTANSTATSHHHSGRSSFSGSTAFSTLREFDLNRQRSPSPHRKTSCHSFFYTSSSDCNNNINSSHFDGQGLGPAVSKVKDSILRDASPLKSTDILKTFRAFKSESNLNAGGNSLPPLHPGVSATRTSCRVIIEETTSSTPDQESRPTAHCGSRRPGRRLSVDIVNSSRGAAVSREGSTASSSSGVSSGSSRVSGSDTKRASPESDLASSVFSTPLSGSSDSVDTSASTLSGDSSGVVGERGPTHLSQRRISLEQRFQARFASPERTVFTGGIGTNGTASATTTSSRLFAEGNRTVFSESSVGPDGTQSQRIRVSGTVRTSCEFSRVSGGSASSRTSWEFVRCGGEGDSNSGAQVAHEEPRVDTTGAQPNHKGFFQGDEELDESYRSTNGQRQSRETRRRPVPALRKISLPQTASYQSQRPEPAPRRKSLTSIVSVESMAYKKKEEGNQLYKLKKYKEAIHKYTEAIDLCPESEPERSAFLGNRAACYLMLGQPKHALEDAKKATFLDNSYSKGWSRQARCHVLLGEAMQARQALANVTAETDKQNEMANIEKLEKFHGDAMASIESLDYRKALFCVDRALEVATHASNLKVLRAECLAYLGRYAESSEVTNTVLQFDTRNTDAFYVRGLCLYYEDNVEKAFSHFKHVLSMAPDHKKALRALKNAKALKEKKEEGNAAFKAGRLDEAYRLYSEALEIDPANKGTNAKLCFNRATVTSKQRKFEESIADCTKAIELDSGYVKAYLRRAKSYMENEQYEEAIRDYDQMCKLDKTNREYRNLLNNAKLELKKSKRKDYYKLLGVGKNANDEEIKKAYRKRAMVHHPDRHSGATEEEKKEHEQKFKEIGEAYAVLSDEKKRYMYDSGQDLDDMNGGGGGHAYHDIDPNQIFQAFFSGPHGGGMGGGGQHFSHSFGGPGSNSFSFQFG